MFQGPRLAKVVVDRITHKAHTIETVRLSTDGWQANDEATIGRRLVATRSMTAARVRTDPRHLQEQQVAVILDGHIADHNLSPDTAKGRPVDSLCRESS